MTLLLFGVAATVLIALTTLAGIHTDRRPLEPVDYDVLAKPLVRAADTAQTLDPAIWSTISDGLPPQLRPTWKDYLP